jgi:hypothetical protein
MNKTVSSLLLLVLLSSCDPEYCLTETISNNTNMDFYIVRAGILADTTFIEKKANKDISVTCATGGVILYYGDYDSVYVKSKTNKILRIYHPLDEGKNIFDASDWEKENISKRNDRYSFSINDDDFIEP